jgi:outer membrane receptor protein involved in Fe transport
MGHTSRQADRDQQSLNRFTDPDSLALIDQQTGSTSTTNSLSTRVAWTEPLVTNWQAQLTYNPAVTRSHSDARTFAFDSLTSGFTTLDPVLSNTFANRNTIQNGGGAVLFTHGPWRWLTQASYQSTRLESDQSFPVTGRIDHTYEDVLPSMTLSATFANRRNLRLNWSTSSNPPNISQLQPVVDNSNPLSLSAGNPALRETYANNFSLRLSEADPMKSKSRFVFANVVRTSNPISNYTFTAPFDTTVTGIALVRGTQLTRPVNLDVSWAANVFAAYSRPAKWLKSIVTLNGGGSWNETPSQLNVGVNRNRATTVSYQGNYNMSRNTLAANTTADYYAHNFSLRLNALAKNGIMARQEVSNVYQNNQSQVFGQNQVLWNTSFGKKFLKDEKGELRFTITDVLHQDKSVGRSFTETYVQDSRDLALGTFMQLVYTYTFR